MRRARAGRGGQGRQQVGGVGATVARQQGHLMVVLGCGQARVGRCGGNRKEERGDESSGEHLCCRTPASSFTSDDNQLSTTLMSALATASSQVKQLHGERHLKRSGSLGISGCLLRDYGECALAPD